MPATRSRKSSKSPKRKASCSPRRRSPRSGCQGRKRYASAKRSGSKSPRRKSPKRKSPKRKSPAKRTLRPRVDGPCGKAGFSPRFLLKKLETTTDYDSLLRKVDLKSLRNLAVSLVPEDQREQAKRQLSILHRDEVCDMIKDKVGVDAPFVKNFFESERKLYPGLSPRGKLLQESRYQRAISPRSSVLNPFGPGSVVREYNVPRGVPSGIFE